MGFKHVRDLKMAVSNYSAMAPFTLSLIESHSDQWLTPNDYFSTACATFSGGDYVLWKTDFVENRRKGKGNQPETAQNVNNFSNIK